MPSQLPQNWKCSEPMGVPYKRFEALPVLTAGPERVEARKITAEYFFLSLTCSASTGFRRDEQHSCLEAHGAECSFTEARRLYKIAASGFS